MRVTQDSLDYDIKAAAKARSKKAAARNQD
jgi:hypothetical protein